MAVYTKIGLDEINLIEKNFSKIIVVLKKVLRIQIILSNQKKEILY